MLIIAYTLSRETTGKSRCFQAWQVWAAGHRPLLGWDVGHDGGVTVIDREGPVFCSNTLEAPAEPGRVMPPTLGENIYNSLKNEDHEGKLRKMMKNAQIAKYGDLTSHMGLERTKSLGQDLIRLYLDDFLWQR